MEALLAKFVAAWNVHDAAAMAACWTDDGDLVTTGGVYACGRAEIAAVLAVEHLGVLRETRATMQLVRVRTIAPAMRALDAQMYIDGPRGVVTMRVALLVREDAGGWRYVMARPGIA